ncbi:Gfo/Idh/MocA family oxidoreductase [Candidatus Poribacteria bacterium]|nr:Gfo/Idh/MocA family oxidoreductase [Candidatus Poribacteria bacterium]
MNKLGVGLMGSDVHVSGYIKAFTACPDAELIGVADDEEQIAQDLCRQGQMKYATTDYQQLLDDADIQIILVCTPDLFHAEHAIAALRAGKHDGGRYRKLPKIGANGGRNRTHVHGESIHAI